VRGGGGQPPFKECTEICPTGKSPDFLSIPRRKNILVFLSTQITPQLSPIPSHKRGRIAIVTDVGCGMRWMRECRKTNGTRADGKAVWS